MEVLLKLFPNMPQIFQMAWVLFFDYYGWLLFIVGFYHMFKFSYVEEIQHQFLLGTEWVFLQIIVPRENTQSTLAVENIFAQLHVLHRSLTWAEKYIEGKFQLWYSLELISMGGKISFILRVPKKAQHLVESSFYSHYPNAEIHEVEDYMKNFNYDPKDENSPVEIFGTEWKLTTDSVVPIRTYVEFEHPTAEEKIIDPLANMFQTMERLQPWEFAGIQILIQPIQNDEFRDRALNKIKELTGEEMPHAASFLNFFMKPFDAFSKLSYKETLLGGHHGHGDEQKSKNNWLNMTEGEKERVALIEKKMAKPNYQTKMRLLYIAPKDKYDKGRRFEIIGGYRHFSSGYFNTIKTDNRIWTKVDYLVSPGLEKPYLDWETRRRKWWFMRGYKNRSMYVGSPKFLLNTEELATLYHFPITKVGMTVSAGVEATSSKKVQAPVNLPISEDY